MKARSTALVIGIVGIVTVLSACGGDDTKVADTLPVMVAESTTTIPFESTTTLTANPEFYTIQQGDTLSAIAASFGVTVADIVAANGLANADASGAKLVSPPLFQSMYSSDSHSLLGMSTSIERKMTKPSFSRADMR